MVSAFTHAYFAFALRSCYPADPLARRLTLLGMACAAAPDLDTIGYWLGVPYEHALGHRGITHGLPFAVALALAVGTFAFRDVARGSRRHLQRVRYLFMATLSHGVLDMLTNGGLGIAFLSPFSEQRFFLPWRPVEVAPIGVRAFFTDHGAHVFASELLWVWLPATVLALLVWWLRRRSGAAAA